MHSASTLEPLRVRFPQEQTPNPRCIAPEGLQNPLGLSDPRAGSIPRALVRCSRPDMTTRGRKLERRRADHRRPAASQVETRRDNRLDLRKSAQGDIHHTKRKDRGRIRDAEHTLSAMAYQFLDDAW